MNLRIGQVSSVNPATHSARVFFPDEKIVSDWLKVVKSPPTVTASVAVTVAPWMPNINDVVLAVYNDEFNADGFILGAL